MTRWYNADESRLTHRRAALRDLEHDTDPDRRDGAAADRPDRAVSPADDGAARRRVRPAELGGGHPPSGVLDRAFELLKASGTVSLQPDGRLAGCWVMPIDDRVATDEDTPSDDEAETPDNETRAKVIVRSDGTVTYIGKDIAYQLWKFGLLGRDFHYRWFDAQLSGRPLWATSSVDIPLSPDRGPVPHFGRAGAVYNVIDTRQSYLQRLIVQALTAMQHPREAERSVHFSYEMVALSHATARALGYGDAGTAADKAFVEVSGRKGLGVKADDLLDQVTDRAEREVAARHADLAADERRRIAVTIGTAAVRYFLIKFSPGKLIAFDIDEALSFEGETGPYLQYATVRARKILQKLRDRDGIETAALLESLASTRPRA